MTEQLYSYTATAFIIHNHSQEMSQPIHEAIHLFICRQYTDIVWFRHVLGQHLQPTVILVFMFYTAESYKIVYKHRIINFIIVSSGLFIADLTLR